eukprot:1159596-Pelagomonas_calceolata.AAC.1
MEHRWRIGSRQEDCLKALSGGGRAWHCLGLTKRQEDRVLLEGDFQAIGWSPCCRSLEGKHRFHQQPACAHL